MMHNPPKGDFPILVSEKKRMFSHPKQKSYYSKKEVFDVRSKLSLPLSERYCTEDQKKIIKLATEEILDSWTGTRAALGVQGVIFKSLNDLSDDFKSIPLRRDDSLAEVHPIEVGLHLNDVHAMADTILGGILHDHLEDIEGMGAKKLIQKLTVNTGRRQDNRIARVLAECAVWHAVQLTDIPLPDKRMKIFVPSDWRNPQNLSYLEKKHATRQNYITRLNACKLPDPRLIKMFDTLSNVVSLVGKDPHKFLDLMFNTVWKANMHVDNDKKWDIIVPYLTLKAQELVNSQITAAYPDSLNEFYARTNIALKDMIATEFPYAIYTNTNYHLYSKSFDQLKYEGEKSIRTSLRKRLTPSLLKEQPYADSHIAVIYSESIKGCHKIGFNPIEIQLPRFVPKYKNRPSCPLIESDYYELNGDKVKAQLQKDLDNARFEFNVVQTNSFLPGPLGMNFLIYRLDFKDYSKTLEDYFGGKIKSSQDYLQAQFAREEEFIHLLQKLQNLLQKYISKRKILENLITRERE